MLALAVVHHLAIAHNLPLPRIAEFFARIARRSSSSSCRRDSQLQRMLATREDIFDRYTAPTSKPPSMPGSRSGHSGARCRADHVDEKARNDQGPFSSTPRRDPAVLSMFAANPGQRSANELTDSLWIVLGAAVVLLLVAAAVYRELRGAPGLRPAAGLVAAGRRRMDRETVSERSA